MVKLRQTISLYLNTTVKVVINAGCKVCVFCGQTIRVGIKKEDA